MYAIGYTKGTELGSVDGMFSAIQDSRGTGIEVVLVRYRQY